MRRGPKIGLVIFGLAVVGGVMLLTRPPVDELAWIRKYGGQQNFFSANPADPAQITYYAEFFYGNKIPPPLIASIRQGEQGIAIIDTEQYESYDLPNGQSVMFSPKAARLAVSWSRDKSWLQRRWEGLKATLGFRDSNEITLSDRSGVLIDGSTSF